MRIGPSSRRGRRSSALLCAALCAWGTVASADVTIGYDPSPADFYLCTPDADTTMVEIVTVGITVDAEAIDLRGMSLVLEYDPVFVQPLAVEAGTLLLTDTCGHHIEWVNEFALGDSIAVDAVGLGCSVDGPGEYVRIVFGRVFASAFTTTLTCRSVILRNSDNVTLPHTCDTEIIQCVPEIPVETESWSTIKAVFRKDDETQ